MLAPEQTTTSLPKQRSGSSWLESAGARGLVASPEQRERAIRWAVAGMAFIAFLLRVFAIFWLRRWQYPNAMEHPAIAMSLLTSGTFSFRDFGYFGPSSVQSPPYPFLLFVLFKLLGPDSAAAYTAAMLINALAGAITVWFSFKLVRSIGGNTVAALFTAALVAVWPSQIYAATAAQAVSLITLCVVAMMYFFDRSTKTGRLAPWIGYSLLGTIGSLTEPVLLPVTALSGLMILFWPRLRFPIRLRNAAVLFAAAMLILMPWAVRNKTVHGRWIPIKSTFWVNVWKGNNEYATGTDRLELTDEQQARLKDVVISLSDEPMVNPEFDKARQYDRLTTAQLRLLNKQPEAVREDVFKEFATAWIKTHKSQYARLCAVRLWKTLWVDWDNPKTHSLFFWLPRSLMLLLIVPGTWIALRQRWSLLYPALLTGSCLLTYTLTITAARFSLPLEPLALAFVAALLVWIAGYRNAGEQHPQRL